MMNYLMNYYHLQVVVMNYYLQAVEVLLQEAVLPLVEVLRLRVVGVVVECLSVVV
jgi:hypothetical protein